MDKPTLCLDFDGVIHSYESGWQGVATIPDPPTPGARSFVERAMEHFRVVIFSTRCASSEGRAAIARWLYNNDFPQLTIAKTKPPALITIDDRALTFTGEWPELEDLLAFKPWNRA